MRVAVKNPEWNSGPRANQLLEGRIESLTANKKLAITIPASMIAMLSIIAFRCIPIPGMTSSEFATTGMATAATVCHAARHISHWTDKATDQTENHQQQPGVSSQLGEEDRDDGYE